MPLVRLSERISYLPHVEELDRPVLALVRGDRLALAVDAGYSPRHVADLYRTSPRSRTGTGTTALA